MKNVLAQIRHPFFGEPSLVRRAFKLLEAETAGKLKPNLAHLLRHHSEKDISDRETWDRDSFDYLLAYFSMVEVASLAGFLTGKLSPAHVAMTKSVLGHAAVRQYYEEYYPLLLPQAHLLRVLGKPIDRGAENSSPSAFETFFSLSAPIETGTGVETFLWFLDGGSRDGVDISDAIDVLANGESFITHMGALPKTDEALPSLTASVHGFVDFIRFAVTFAEFLDQNEINPLLQSAMWHYHGYWFDRMSMRMGSNVRQALDNYTTCYLSAQDGAARAKAKDLAEARKVQTMYRNAITRLSSGRYRYLFYEALVQK